MFKFRKKPTSVVSQLIVADEPFNFDVVDSFPKIPAWESAGFLCPTNNPRHQPFPDPWWSGSSYFRDHPSYQVNNPIGPWFHVTNLRPVPDSTPWVPRVGEMLTSPAVRRELPGRTGAIAEDGCLSYANYDPHAVYVTNETPMFADLANEGSVILEVAPRGKIWRDPETLPSPNERGQYCCDNAVIVRIFKNLDECGKFVM